VSYDDWKTDPDWEDSRLEAMRKREERNEALAEQHLQEWKDGERAINGKYRGEK
jgi:hypothetical protein